HAKSYKLNLRSAFIHLFKQIQTTVFINYFAHLSFFQLFYRRKNIAYVTFINHLGIIRSYRLITGDKERVILGFRKFLTQLFHLFNRTGSILLGRPFIEANIIKPIAFFALKLLFVLLVVAF